MRSCFAITVAACAALALGCGTADLSDTSLAACFNPSGEVDCSNPDCQYLKRCLSRSAPVTNVDDGDDRMDAGNDAAAPDAQVEDGGLDAGDSPNVDAGDDDDDMDAGVVPDAGDLDASLEDAGDALAPDAGPPACDEACAVDEACIDGACVHVGSDVSGMISLRILTASVPLESPIDACYDVLCPGMASAPFGVCLCPPDPYVVVQRSRAGQVVEVGRTSVADDVEMATYDDDPFTIELLEGDVLMFAVWDYDGSSLDPQFLYSCTLNLSVVEDGPISCMAQGSVAWLRTFEVTAEIAVVP